MERGRAAWWAVAPGTAPGAELVRSLRVRGTPADLVDLPVDPAGAARELYSLLRTADASGAGLLVIPAVDPAGVGRAVNDRLYRAAHGRVVLDASAATLERIALLVG